MCYEEYGKSESISKIKYETQSAAEFYQENGVHVRFAALFTKFEFFSFFVRFTHNSSKRCAYSNSRTYASPTRT